MTHERRAIAQERAELSSGDDHRERVAQKNSFSALSDASPAQQGTEKKELMRVTTTRESTESLTIASNTEGRTIQGEE